MRDLKDAWTKLRTRPLRSLFSVLLCALIGCGTIPVISSQEAPNPTASDFRECFESRSSGSIGSFAVERGASVPDRSGTESEVDLDFATFVEGKASLRLRSIASDTTWYSAGMSLDPRLSQITVTYQVRGDSIASRWDPYNNAYVGIAVHRGDRVMFQGNSYEGSFDWRRDSLTIAIPEDSDIRSIRLVVFLSKPGTLWVDAMEVSSTKAASTVGSTTHVEESADSTTVTTVTEDVLGDVPAAFRRPPDSRTIVLLDSLRGEKLSFHEDTTFEDLVQLFGREPVQSWGPGGDNPGSLHSFQFESGNSLFNFDEDGLSMIYPRTDRLVLPGMPQLPWTLQELNDRFSDQIHTVREDGFNTSTDYYYAKVEVDGALLNIRFEGDQGRIEAMMISVSD